MIFARIKENGDVMHGEQQQEEDQSINRKQAREPLNNNSL
jgi:hypothetical protein